MPTMSKSDWAAGMITFCVEPPEATGLSLRASGATGERDDGIWTTEPGVAVLYREFLDGSFKGKGGSVYQKRTALCLETQHFPDSPIIQAFRRLC